MAGRIAGITIEIEGNTTKLQTALKDTNKELKTTQTNLKDVEKLLKLDPANVELLKQKQELLKKAVEETKTKLDTEKEALKQLKEADQTPEVVAQQEALERQIADDEAALKSLNEEQKRFGSVGLQQFQAVGQKIGDVGTKMVDLGNTLTAKVTAPIMALAAASVAAFKSVDDGYDEMIKKTGATGKEADALRKTMNNLATEIPTDFNTAGKAVGEVSTRFGIVGDDLEDLSGLFIKFADLNNTDVANSVDKVQKALASYGKGADDAEDFLNRLNKTGQETGISVDKLADGVVNNAASFQELGMSIDEAVVFMGDIEKSGANADTVMSGLSKALKNATKDGKPLNQALDELQDTILNGTDGMDGLTAAYDLFGKNGAQIYEAVKNGTIDFENLGKTVSDASGSIESTFAETLDPIDQFKTVMNEVKIAGAELGATILEFVSPAMSKLSEIIKKLKAKWDNLTPAQKKMIVTIGAIVAAIGPLITILGGVALAISALMSPIGLVVVAIAAAIAAGVLLYKNWDKIKAFAKKLWSELRDKFTKIKQTIVDSLTKARDKVVEVWNKIKTTFSNALNAIKTTVTNIFNKIKTVIATIMIAKLLVIRKTLDTIKTVFSTVWNTIKKTVTTVITAIKTTVSNVINTIKNIITTVFTAISTTISNIINKIKTTVSNVFTTIKDTLSTIWNSIKDTATTVWNTVKDKISEAINTAKSKVSTAVGTIKSVMSTTWVTIKSTVSTAWDTVKTKVTTAINGAKSGVSTAVSTIKSVMSTAWTAVKSTASDKWAGIKSAISDPIGSAKSAVSTAVSTIKSVMSTAWTSIKSTASEKWESIKSKITEPINSAKNTVSSIIETIKGYFPFSLGKIMSFKLPSISVNAGTPPWGIGGFGTKPSFSVNWNSYATGAIFRRPTMFATPYGFKQVGEAGAEAVLPLDTLWQQMSAMSENIVQGVTEGIANNQSMMVESMYKAMIAAFQELNFSIDNREFARILRNYGAIT